MFEILHKRQNAKMKTSVCYLVIWHMTKIVT
jgi:hypothetical protein